MVLTRSKFKTLKGYYVDGEDAYIMRHELHPENLIDFGVSSPVIDAWKKKLEAKGMVFSN